ncbi:aprataxin and PNK-like factor isoform X2 [Venturia canescens]|nr:aprataxin and PNK-like factor isoform X2 [Venturia canescens]
MTITPMLACFMRCSSSGRWLSLKIGKTVPIELGDICSLYPHKSWFKVTSGETPNNMEEESPKRKASGSSEEEPPDKKLRKGESVDTIYSQNKIVLDNWDNEETSNIPENDDSIIQQPHDSNKDSSDTRDQDTARAPSEFGSAQDIWNNSENGDTSCPINLTNNKNDSSTKSTGSAHLSSKKECPSLNKDEAGKKIKWDCAHHFSDQTDQGTSATPAAETKDDTNSGQENNPTAETNVASSEPQRNKCAYGSRCYRRNSDHRRQFSHPGDPDYDIPDTRPECPYGIKCYRKNPQHKRDFKHTNLRPSRAQTPIRGQASDATLGTEQSSAEESVDESEYEPSYYGGTTSEEYRSDLDGFSDFEEGISDGEDDK